MAKKKWFGTLVLSSVLALGLTACGSDNNEKSDSGLSKIAIGYQNGMPTLTLMKERGELDKKLKDKGIDVTWTQFSATPDMISAIDEGKGLDFGGGGGPGPVFGQASGKKFVKVAAQNGSPEGSQILVLEDSDIQSIEDLKGKKVAVTKGTTQQYLLATALEQVGLNLTDVETVYLAASEGLTAFKKGEVDAFVIWDPITAQAQAQAKTRTLASNLSIFGETAVFEGAPYYFSTQELVNEHPDVLTIIIDELKATAEWEAQNRAESAKILAQVYNADEASLAVAQERGGDRAIIPLTDELLTIYQKQADLFFELGLIPNAVDLKDPSYNWMNFGK